MEESTVAPTIELVRLRVPGSRRALGHDGSGQGRSSGIFATTNGGVVQTSSVAPTGDHACTVYMERTQMADRPTRSRAYDGGRVPAPTDSRPSRSRMPEEVGA